MTGTKVCTKSDTTAKSTSIKQLICSRVLPFPYPRSIQNKIRADKQICLPALVDFQYITSDFRSFYLLILLLVPEEIVL